MNVVEIRLSHSELSSGMGEMRRWLDEQGFESSGFSCRDDDHDGFYVQLLFKAVHQARAFAARFGGRAIAIEPGKRPEAGSFYGGLVPFGATG